MKKYLCVILAISLFTVLTGCSQPSNFSGGGRDEVIPEISDNDTSVEDLNTSTEEVINTSTDESNTPVEDIKVLNPLPPTLDLNNITNAKLLVSLMDDSIDTVNKTISFAVYDFELFDMVELSQAKSGDTININNNLLVIESIEHTESGAYLINGGLDVGGYELITDDSTVYYSIGYSDYIEYRELGEVKLAISDNFQFIDATDLDNDPVTYDLSTISNADFTGTPHELKLTVEDGVITELHKRYTP